MPDIEKLIREAAEYWTMRDDSCSNCKKPLFRNNSVAGSTLEYHRCPTCQINTHTNPRIPYSNRAHDRYLDKLVAVYDPRKDYTPQD